MDWLHKGVLVLSLSGLLAVQWLECRRDDRTFAALTSLGESVKILTVAVGTATHPVIAPNLSMSDSCVRNPLSPDELRVIVREELRGLDRKEAGQFGTAPSPSSSANAEDQLKNLDAYTQAQRVVDDAIAASVWRERDREIMHSIKAQLTGEQLQTIMAELLPAINTQKVRADVQGMPF